MTLRMRYRVWTWLAIVALMTILFVVCAWVGNLAAEPVSAPSDPLPIYCAAL